MTTKPQLTWRQKGVRVLLLLAFAFFALATPSRTTFAVPAREAEPFAWNSNPLWRDLERQFSDARLQPARVVNPRIELLFTTLRSELALIESTNAGPNDTRYNALSNDLFTLAALVAAHPSHARAFADLVNDLRLRVRRIAEGWPARSVEARQRLYRLLYGTRAALEEVLLQASSDAVPALMLGVDEPSRTPHVDVRGVRIHSGDILVSRGSAATSALIARGNDYPGNFSHVALVYIDEQTHTFHTIESHIETGAVVSDLDTYLGDGKLRILVLRTRADLPAMQANPMLPHIAAREAYAEASGTHIPYDFEMNHEDPSKRFCSEVASAAYSDHGIALWQNLSSMSSHANSFWLASFGVTHFDTQAPADLEYDTQLRIVAEWRNREQLLRDHVDNAIVDALLEEADRGEPIHFSWWKLPGVRLAKAYSVVLNWVGKVGPVPEGMSASVALRAMALAERHARIRARLMHSVRAYREERNAMPPYWDLVDFARTATASTPW